MLTIRRAASWAGRRLLVCILAVAALSCRDTPMVAEIDPPAPAFAKARVDCPSGFTFFTRWEDVDWCVFQGRSNPGNNRFLRTNVQLTNDGISLMIRNSGGWTSAWVCSANKYDNGTFEFRVKGGLEGIDPNLVFALYLDDLGQTPNWHELDIEFARWGDPNAPNLQYVMWRDKKATPAKESSPANQTWPYRTSKTTHRILWRPGKMAAFESYDRWSLESRNRMRSWEATKGRVPTQPMNVCFQLWLTSRNRQPGAEPAGPYYQWSPIPITVTRFRRTALR